MISSWILSITPTWPYKKEHEAYYYLHGSVILELNIFQYNVEGLLKWASIGLMQKFFLRV